MKNDYQVCVAMRIAGVLVWSVQGSYDAQRALQHAEELYAKGRDVRIYGWDFGEYRLMALTEFLKQFGTVTADFE